jgi:hypothetical protein
MDIINFAKNKKINVCFFTVPVSQNTKNKYFFKKMKSKIPNLYDFHNVIREDKYFSDNCHLNDQGATVFTTILIEKLNL